MKPTTNYSEIRNLEVEGNAVQRKSKNTIFYGQQVFALYSWLVSIVLITPPPPLSLRFNLPW